MYVTKCKYAPSQPARNATRGRIALVQHPARNAVCAAFAAVSSSVITASVNHTQTAGALRTSAARKQQFRAQLFKQQHPGGRSAFTHVCRVLTESADMALGSKAPEFEVWRPDWADWQKDRDTKHLRQCACFLVSSHCCSINVPSCTRSCSESTYSIHGEDSRPAM